MRGGLMAQQQRAGRVGGLASATAVAAGPAKRRRRAHCERGQRELHGIACTFLHCLSRSWRRGGGARIAKKGGVEGSGGQVWFGHSFRGCAVMAARSQAGPRRPVAVWRADGTTPPACHAGDPAAATALRGRHAVDWPGGRGMGGGDGGVAPSAPKTGTNGARNKTTRPPGGGSRRRDGRWRRCDGERPRGGVPAGGAIYSCM